MAGKGIDRNTCPKVRPVRSLWTDAEKAFSTVLMNAFHMGRVKVFIKVSVLDVLQLDAAEPDKKRLFFSPCILGDKHFDYVVCRSETLEPLLAVELDDPTTRRRATTADDVKATAARLAAFPVVRFSADASKLTPELVRAKLIAEYRVVRADAAGGDGVNRDGVLLMPGSITISSMDGRRMEVFNMSDHKPHQVMAAALRELNLEESFDELHQFSRPQFATKPKGLDSFCVHCDKHPNLRAENRQTIARVQKFMEHVRAHQPHNAAIEKAWAAYPLVTR